LRGHPLPMGEGKKCRRPRSHYAASWLCAGRSPSRWQIA
jgi:hypothetical protein